MTPDELYAIIGSITAATISLAVLILRATSRSDRVRSEGAADRRALQASMDTFRTEMQRLAGRQSRLEGAAGG